MTDEQRCDPSNGIWLCREHAALVDRDAEHFTVELLRRWRADREFQASLEMRGLDIGRGLVTGVRITNLGRFLRPQELRFTNLNLLLGPSTTGKTLIADMASSVGDATRATKWLSRRNQGRSVVAVEAFVGTRHEIGITYAADGLCYSVDSRSVPVLPKLFNVHYYEEALPSAPEKDDCRSPLESFMSMRAEEIETMIQMMALKPGLLVHKIRSDDSRLLVQVTDKSPFISFGGLSSGERQRALLELAITKASFYALVSPTLLVLDQYAFPTVEASGLREMLRQIRGGRFGFQVIVCLYRWPEDLATEGWSVWQLKEEGDGCICEAVG